MRRTTLLLSSFAAAGLALALLPAASALAPAAARRSGTTVVVPYLNEPDPVIFAAAQVSCTSLYSVPMQGNGAVGVSTSPTPVVGKQSWSYADWHSGTALAFDWNPDVFDSATVASIRAYSQTSITGVSYVVFQPTGQVKHWVGRATLSEPHTSGFQTIDLSGITYTWLQFDSSNQSTGASMGATTPSAFVTSHGGSGTGEYEVGIGCDSETGAIDAMTLGQPGSPTTYDLAGYETAPTASQPLTVTAGSPATLTTKVLKIEGGQEHGTITSGLVKLQSKAGGLYTTVASGTLGATGGKATVEPHVTTTYRWSFPGGSTSLEGSSVPFTVRVATAVTAKPGTYTVTQGASYAVTGHTTPAKPGTTVKLWQQVAGADHLLGSAVVGAQGTYTVHLKGTTVGKVALYVSIPATTANVAGRSKVFSIKVVKPPHH